MRELAAAFDPIDEHAETQDITTVGGLNIRENQGRSQNANILESFKAFPCRRISLEVAEPTSGSSDLAPRRAGQRSFYQTFWRVGLLKHRVGIAT